MNIASHIFSFGIKLASCLIIVIGMSGCHEIYDPDFISNAPYGNNPGNRVMVPNDRRVLLMYLAGYNSLSDCLRDDLNDVMNGWLPGTDKKDNVLLVYTHQPKRDGMYSVKTNPYLLTFPHPYSAIWKMNDGMASFRLFLFIFPFATKHAFKAFRCKT